MDINDLGTDIEEVLVSEEQIAARLVELAAAIDEDYKDKDILLVGGDVTHLSAPRIATRNTHGTGCTLSAAMAALRPQRDGWAEATRDAKDYLTQALAASERLDVGVLGNEDPRARRRAGLGFRLALDRADRARGLAGHEPLGAGSLAAQTRPLQIARTAQA